MARQVFFDPFGSYTRGFDAGAQRQTGLEDSVRRARAQDYDFNVLQPYRTAALQRGDQLDTAAQPYKINMLPIGYQNAVDNLYGNEFNQGMQLAKIFNLTQPLMNTVGRHFGINFATAGNGDGSATTAYMHGPDGRLYPVAQQPNYGQQILNNINWERLFQARQADNMNNYRNSALGVSADRYDAYRLGQQAQLLRAMNAGSGGFSPTGIGVTGFGGYTPDLSDFGVQP